MYHILLQVFKAILVRSIVGSYYAVRVNLEQQSDSFSYRLLSFLSSRHKCRKVACRDPKKGQDSTCELAGSVWARCLSDDKERNGTHLKLERVILYTLQQALQRDADFCVRQRRLFLPCIAQLFFFYKRGKERLSFILFYTFSFLESVK